MPDPEGALTRLPALPIEQVADSAAATRAALTLARRLDHPVYDCLYPALAIARAAALPPERLVTPPG